MSQNQEQTVTVIDHLSQVVDDYGVFVFPIYGTLHTGKALNENALECLQELSALGKTVVIFSNVPKRRSVLIQELDNMGIPPSLYQHIISAGEEAYQALESRSDPFHAGLGDKCYVFGSAEALELLDGLALSRVFYLDEAEFILAFGPDEWHDDLAYYKPLLKSAYDLGLPLVCGSPDLYVKYEGHKTIRAGALAAYYEALGGDVVYHGKPHPKFYRTLLDSLNLFEKEDILILGDSVTTDIQGAGQQGFDTLLCLTETTAVELQVPMEKLVTETSQDLVLLLQKQSHQPTFVTHPLTW